MEQTNSIVSECVAACNTRFRNKMATILPTQFSNAFAWENFSFLSTIRLNSVLKSSMNNTSPFVQAQTLAHNSWTNGDQDLWRIIVSPWSLHNLQQTIKFRAWHDDVIKWKYFPRNRPFVRGIHRLPVNSPHKGQWRGALMFSLICAWTNGWANNRNAGYLRRHYDVPVIKRVWIASFLCQRISY